MIRIIGASASAIAVFFGVLGASVANCQTAWFNQPQFFKFDEQYQTTDPLIQAVPFTGQAWGLYVPTPPTNAQLDTGTAKALASDVAAWRFGGPYFVASNLIRLYASPPSTWDLFRMRTLDGSYMNDYLGSALYPLYSLSSSVFQSFLKAQAQAAVDIGADGFLMDDPQGQVFKVIQETPQNAGSFDTVTMAAFQGYLRQKYTPGVLQQKFGIGDIDSFDFGNYIRTNGLAGTWNAQPLSGLSLEFYFFKVQETANFLRDLVSSTKRYARQVYNRDFLFTCNCGYGYLGAEFARDAMDLATNESYYLEISPTPFSLEVPFVAPYIRAGKGWKSPQLVLAETGTLVTPGFLAKPTTNLMRLILADIYAGGGIPVVEDQMNVWYAPEPVDLSIVRRYANFALANPQLLSQTTTPARVALVEAAPSVIGNVISTPNVANPWSGATNYIGTARLLLDTGITYDSSFFPDTTYSTTPSPQASDLARYGVVIAPSAFILDDNQTATLLQYAHDGGTLIIDGDFAVDKPDGTPASHPELQSILAAPGQTAYGAGRIVFSKELFGVDYQATSGGTVPGVDNAAQRQARASFQTFLSPYIQPDVRVTQPPAQSYEPGITPFLYHDSAGNNLVHLVNYDYDFASDQFSAKTNIPVQVEVGSQSVDEVILRSPDFAGTQVLPFARSGDTITVTVPKVDAWAILYFQRNALAPVINSFSPAVALGAVAGNSLSFSVQAADPDGNPLTYIWSVNGQVVSDIFGSSYSLQLPLTASGTYTVSVSVTDGSRTTQNTWTINVAGYKRPRVLFDESHGEQYTLDAARASQLNPQHPDWALLGVIDKAMQPLYQVSRFSAGSITNQVLSGADVLVLASPSTPLAPAENQAISTFVQAGGGLIFLGDEGSNPAINTVIGQWGLQFDPTLIESLQGPEFNLSSFANHPAVSNNPTFRTDYSGSFSLSQGAIALGQTSAAEWKSTSGKPTQQPGEPNGPFVMIAAASPGKGRVFVCDTAFFDAMLSFTTNQNLFLSAAAWVSGSANAPPAAPQTTKLSVTSVVNAGSYLPAISPGSWVSVFGSNLASTSPAGQSWTAGDFQGNRLPTSLDGTRVLINGRSAAVYFVSPGQLNVQVSDDTAQGTAAVQVITPSGNAQQTATLVPIGPSVFPVTVSGVNYAAAVAADGTLLAAPGQIAGARAANHGETILIFGTGFGDTVPHQPAGQLVNPSPLANAVTATICGQPANVTYAGLVEAGLDQFNVVVPGSVSGNCSVVFHVAGESTQSDIVLPVAN